MSHLVHRLAGAVSDRNHKQVRVLAWTTLAALVAGSLCACASSEPATTCTPGKTKTCQCASGGTGTQTCKSSGAWGSCVCSSGDGSTAEDSSSKADIKPPDGKRQPDWQSKMDTGQSKLDKKAPAADRCADVCICGSQSGQIAKGQTWTITVGGQQVSVKVTDFGFSGSKPAALMSIDGGGTNIVTKGMTLTSGNDVRVYCSDIQSTTSPTYPTWVKFCASYP